MPKAEDRGEIADNADHADHADLPPRECCRQVVVDVLATATLDLLLKERACPRGT
ncbi:MAG TPA: hypothetical protein VF550_02150 [Polyangia bacterium]